MQGTPPLPPERESFWLPFPDAHEKGASGFQRSFRCSLIRRPRVAAPGNNPTVPQKSLHRSATSEHNHGRSIERSFSMRFGCLWTMAPTVLLSVSFLLAIDRKSTRLNSSHLVISYAVFCL